MNKLGLGQQGFDGVKPANGDARRVQRGLESCVLILRDIGGRGSGMKAPTGSPPCDLLRASRFGCRCHEGHPYWTNASNGDRYWCFSGKLHIRLPLSPKCGAVPSISRDPWFGVRLLKQGEPSLCHVIERDAWDLLTLKNQRVGNNRGRSIRAERTARLRTWR